MGKFFKTDKGKINWKNVGLTAAGGAAVGVGGAYLLTHGNRKKSMWARNPSTPFNMPSWLDFAIDMVTPGSLY